MVTLGAALLPTVSRWVRLPSVVVEILFGVILGKSLFNLQFSGEWFPFLADLGFLILMFHAGMEINFTALRRHSARIYTVQAAVFLITVGLSIGAAYLMRQGFYLALVLSTTSLGLVVPALRQAKISQTQMGQSALIAATLADFLTLLVITFFILWHEEGLSWALMRPLPFFIGFGVLLKMVQFLAWWYPEKIYRLLEEDDSQELGVRFSLALLFLFVALSEVSNLEPVLGAFIGGAMVSMVFREKAQLETKLSGFGYGFLIPIFFIHVGTQFDIANVFSLEQFLFTSKLLGLAILVKVIPSILFVLTGLSFMQSMTVGVLMTSRLSLIIVAATIGLELGFITAAFKDAIILLAIITCLLGPSLFRALHRGNDESGRGTPGIDRRRLLAGWMREGDKKD